MFNIYKRRCSSECSHLFLLIIYETRLTTFFSVYFFVYVTLKFIIVYFYCFVQSTGGIKCTYLINSKLVQNKQVADIFNSVHLNVNNPHFLVMQGQIARILNNNPTQVSIQNICQFKQKKSPTSVLRFSRNCSVEYLFRS